MVKQLFFIISLLVSTITYSQNIPDRVDISYLQSDDNLEIYLIPNYDFDGIFSSIVFSVKSNGELGQFILDPQISNHISISKSGSTHYNDGDQYSIFAGFGFTKIEEDNGWKMGQMVRLGHFDIDRYSNYDLSNDELTNQKNGDYYISLNGRDSSGDIINLEINKKSSSLKVYPNPFLDEIFIFDGGRNIQFVQVLDLTGKILIFVDITQYPQAIDTRDLISGSYFINFIYRDRSRETKKSIKI